LHADFSTSGTLTQRCSTIVLVAVELMDYTQLLEELASASHRHDRGVHWLARVAERIATDAALPALVTTNNELVVDENGQSRRSWDVEVVLGDHSLARIDIDVVSEPHHVEPALAGFDAVLAKACESWRMVTRCAEPAPPRPWLGCLRVFEGEFADDLVQPREARTSSQHTLATALDTMVKDRTLDAACMMVVDTAAGIVSSPIEALSFRAFTASLFGRLVYLNVVTQPLLAR
jgi:hypothetical protein